MPDDTTVAPASTTEQAPLANGTNADVKLKKTEIMAQVAQKISEAHNVLIALSSDPSVDEMAAAIGLSLYLDRLGKRATAIYSGSTPNALEFLKPEETFEDSVDTLQDFVIALNKEKADHLRYKLDGDYVKIFITPYKARIAEEDLEFSYGDFNVDLVLALDVANGIDLDSALREHGRIMHDAVIVNITTGNPGKLGEIEWSDKAASSVSEMIGKLLYTADSSVKVEKEEATAFLTGIVAATERFKNANTTPETMVMASKLMRSGANQQLISKNITADLENELFGASGFRVEDKLVEEVDDAKLDVHHGNEAIVDGPEEVSTTVTEKESTLLDDLKAAEANLAAAANLAAESGEVVQDEQRGPVDMSNAAAKDDLGAETGADTGAGAKGADDDKTVDADDAGTSAGTGADAGADTGADAGMGANTSAILGAPEGFVSDRQEKILQPTGDLNRAEEGNEETNRYSKMLEDALAESPAAKTPVAEAPAAVENPAAAGAPAVGDGAVAAEAPAVTDNPAAMGAPAVATEPEINGVPEINYMPMPGDEVLPPPPAPPIDMDKAAPEPVAAPEPTAAAEPTVVPAPEANSAPGAGSADPGAFKIPGM